MRRIIITSLTLIAAALLVVPAIASAQKRGRPRPKITRVHPIAFPWAECSRSRHKLQAQRARTQ